MEEHGYSCTNQLGAEVLMIITSVCMIGAFSGFVCASSAGVNAIISKKDVSLVLSMVYALFLPLMTYMFSQAKQYSPGRAQVILIWMVLLEIIRVRNDSIYTWELRKSAEQVVRLFWVGFLVCSSKSLNGLRVSLLILCVCFTVNEVLKAIVFKKAKKSYLIGKNPELINDHMKRVMLERDLRTTPMNCCDYIVMGETYHNIDICENGYLFGDKRSDSNNGMITIGRIFQLNSTEDAAFTLIHPYWRDICLSLALAKMLRQRFAKLPLYEVGSSKALDFVLEGLIDYIGTNQDFLIERCNREINPAERVFRIIQNELNIVSDHLLHSKHIKLVHFRWYAIFERSIARIMFCTGIYLIFIVISRSPKWLSLVKEDAYNDCFFHTFRNGKVVLQIFFVLDASLTYTLVLACMVTMAIGINLGNWMQINDIQRYINNPVKYKISWRISIVSLLQTRRLEKESVKKVKGYPLVFKIKGKTIFCVNGSGSALARFVQGISRKFERALPTVINSTDVRATILKTFRNSDGRLTNGESSLKHHQMEDLRWALQPTGRTAEVILVWHIATTLFNHLHGHPTQQYNGTIKKLVWNPVGRIITNICIHNPIVKLCFSHISQPEDNNKPINKDREVALSLSVYCHYLVATFPKLLPGDAKWTKKMYDSVRSEILAIDHSSKEVPLIKDRCDFALRNTWSENSLVGKGAKLARELMNHSDDEARVWAMLADFWAEMMLFIAPSDNVDGHEKLLRKGELITQLWALLMHAGILTRPKSSEYPDHEAGNSNEINEVGYGNV